MVLRSSMNEQSFSTVENRKTENQSIIYLLDFLSDQIDYKILNEAKQTH